MIVVYRLKDDVKHIADVQKAILTTEDYGIKITHGLFGSPEWWKNIDNGTLPLQTLKGKITRVYMSGHNDYPEFEIVTEDGHKESFTREAETEVLDAEYQPGREVEIDFVRQQPKKNLLEQFPKLKKRFPTRDYSKQKIVLEIRLI